MTVRARWRWLVRGARSIPTLLRNARLSASAPMKASDKVPRTSPPRCDMASRFRYLARGGAV